MLPNSNQLKGHLPSVDILRSIAVLSVMVFHYTQVSFSDWTTFHFIAQYGFNGVPLFFFISGFIVPYSMYAGGYRFNQIHRFIGKRAARIEIPYLISILVVILWENIITHVLYGGGGFKIEWMRLLTHLGYVNEFLGYSKFQDIYWSLGIEFQFYLYLALCAPLLWSANKYVRFTPLLIIAIASLNLWAPYATAIYQYGFLFIAGISFFQFTSGLIKPWAFYITLIVALCGVYYQADNRIIACIQIGLVLFGIMTILKFNKDLKFFRFIGKISFSLYLTHMIIAGWGTLTASQLFGIDVQSKMFWTINFGVAIAFGTLFYYVVERPAMKLASRVKYKPADVTVNSHKL
jgi:peptidoglycan/LPS O-acetylase OafA/YrhL